MTKLRSTVARALPPSIAQSIVDRRTARLVGTTDVSESPIRLLIGPANSAGQAHAWARAAERLPEVSAANVVYRRNGDLFRFAADHEVPRSVAVNNRAWGRAQFAAVARRFTHVLIESGQPLFGLDESPLAQARRLHAAGVTVGFVWHGSDVRLPSAHAATERDSPFRAGAYAGTSELERSAAANLELARESGFPSFVSTPDLLPLVPGAKWLPVVVDPDLWARAAGPVLERERPVVVHAPSRAGLKGTELVTPTLRKLHDDRVIEYRELSGIAHSLMPETYGSADIVLDQFSLGIYGVAAVEAFAAGRVVVSHVGAPTTSVVPDLPVVLSRAADLESTLREIVTRRDRYRALAGSAQRFAARLHDGRRSAQVLASFLGADTGTASATVRD